MTSIDLEHLQQWIGRTERCTDIVTAHGVRALQGTLELAPGKAVTPEVLPVTQHWCLALQSEPMSGLADDGHALRGKFLPPVPLPRRMWASGAFTVHHSLRTGDTVERLSRVADIQVKEGRSGVLCFVTVAHEFTTPRGLAVQERQVIVYREESTPTRRADEVAAVATGQNEPRPAQWECSVTLDAVRLFRYSALTFNGHRIHYDRDYCREQGYSGLLVHAPLQASLLAEFARGIQGNRAPREFSFRALAPLFDGGPITLRAATSDQSIELWISDPSGNTTMSATASW